MPRNAIRTVSRNQMMLEDYTVRRFRIDDWPHASDGIEIDLGSGIIRLGIYARRLDQLPTFFSNVAESSDWNIRIGRLGIAFKSAPNNPD